MSGMRITFWGWIVVLGLIVACTPRAVAQRASIDFLAQATPSDGLQEPVRGFPFFLLRKSFADISKEVAATYPRPDMDAFIAKLEVSPELRAWMKKNGWVTLSGEDFCRKLRADDVLGVPEFKKAYMDRNENDESLDFPQPKFKPSDAQKNPAKFKKESEDYLEAVRHYIEQHPETVDGIDLSLAEIDPSPKWKALMASRDVQVHQRVLDLAQSDYLVAHTETNLEGRGTLGGLAPGTYWLTTLDVPAIVGDVRSRWDLPVTVRAGETKYVALSNANAVHTTATQ